jgi:hypothetical protein
MTTPDKENDFWCDHCKAAYDLMDVKVVKTPVGCIDRTLNDQSADELHAICPTCDRKLDYFLSDIEEICDDDA